jgi:hypothetical protein
MTTLVQLHAIVGELYEKYKDNEYVTGRLVNFINMLPATLENALTLHKQREERRKQLLTFSEDFTTRFFNEQSYFYSVYSETFLHYDGLHYYAYNEDDLQHQILSNISRERALMDWKYKIKGNLMKIIKERSLFKAIPESGTIQFVIKALHPSIFPTRNHVKYFLTMLGERMQHDVNVTNNDIVYFISPLAKKFIRAFDNLSYVFALPSILNYVKFKYHDHAYPNCRLIATTPSTEQLTLPVELAKHILDVFVVAAHYTTRYGCADKFLAQCVGSNALVEHAQYLQTRTPEKIVTAFITDPSFFELPNATMDMRSMIFLWKKYLKERHLPNVIFYETLKTSLKTLPIYNESVDLFMNISNTELPSVSAFVKFWETTIITADATEELELDELLMLFKHFCKSAVSYNNNMTEQLMLDLIYHYDPDITVENEKYILHKRCSLWNKRVDITQALHKFISGHGNENANPNANPISISLYDAYTFYVQTTTIKWIASKRYFEKAAKDILLGNEILFT